jgi:TRAP-type C4-dicarboxylate transport system substrate-binding protein
MKMSMLRTFLIVAVFVTTITTLGTQAPQIRLKLGTSAPVGTSPYKELQLMGEKWRKAPAGGVDLQITNTQGGEAATVGRMRVGSFRPQCCRRQDFLKSTRPCGRSKTSRLSIVRWMKPSMCDGN